MDSVRALTLEAFELDQEEARLKKLLEDAQLNSVHAHRQRRSSSLLPTQTSSHAAFVDASRLQEAQVFLTTCVNRIERTVKLLALQPVGFSNEQEKRNGRLRTNLVPTLRVICVVPNETGAYPTVALVLDANSQTFRDIRDAVCRYWSIPHDFWQEFIISDLSGAEYAEELIVTDVFQRELVAREVNPTSRDCVVTWSRARARNTLYPAASPDTLASRALEQAEKEVKQLDEGEKVESVSRFALPVGIETSGLPRIFGSELVDAIAGMYRPSPSVSPADLSSKDLAAQLRLQSRRFAAATSALLGLLFALFSILAALTYPVGGDNHAVALYVSDALKWGDQITFEAYAGDVLEFVRVNALGGHVRFRQLRVTPSRVCDLPPPAVCYPPYEPDEESTEPFGDNTDEARFYYNESYPSTPYQASSLSRGRDSRAFAVETYAATGGYYDFHNLLPSAQPGQDPTGDRFKACLSEAQGWIDEATRFIEMGFNVYFPSSNTLAAVKVVVQYPPYIVYPRVFHPTVLARTLPIVPTDPVTGDNISIPASSSRTRAQIFASLAVFIGLYIVSRNWFATCTRCEASGDEDVAIRLENRWSESSGLFQAASRLLSRSGARPNAREGWFSTIVDLVAICLLTAGLVTRVSLDDTIVSEASTNYVELYHTAAKDSTSESLYAWAAWAALLGFLFRLLALTKAGALILSSFERAQGRLLAIFIGVWLPLRFAVAFMGHIVYAPVVGMHLIFGDVPSAWFSVVSNRFALALAVPGLTYSPWGPLMLLTALISFTLVDLFVLSTLVDDYFHVTKEYDETSSLFTLGEILASPVTLVSYAWSALKKLACCGRERVATTQDVAASHFGMKLPSAQTERARIAKKERELQLIQETIRQRQSREHDESGKGSRRCCGRHDRRDSPSAAAEAPSIAARSVSAGTNTAKPSSTSESKFVTMTSRPRSNDELQQSDAASDSSEGEDDPDAYVTYQ